MEEAAKILLVEDDQALSRGIGFKLAREGFTVLSATSVQEARKLFGSHSVDLVVLDVSLPDGDGFQFCREIRGQSQVPLIFLTAWDQEVDIVMGYELGADDYVTKPFSLSVLVAKIHAIFRRNRGAKGCSMLVSKDIVFYPNKMKVLKKDQEIYLTRTEMRLFRYFTANPQQIITKEQFLAKLWDTEGDFIDDSTLQVHIRRLREKIEDDPSNPQYIKTIRGTGYIWAERCIFH